MRGAICAIFIVILSKNYNGNALSYAWFRGNPLPSFALALFGGYHVIWRRPGRIAVALDHETDLYFGIAARRRLADGSLSASSARF
jgi:hypothetical protein